MMHDIMHDHCSFVKLVDYCTFNSPCTHAPSVSLVPPQSAIKSFRHSVFVNTVFLWNTVPESVLILSSSHFRPALYSLFCHK